MKIALLAAALAVVGVSTVGCSSSAPASPSSPPADYATTKSPGTGQAGTGDAPGPMESQASPDDKAKLDKLEKEYDSAKDALAKSPNDTKARERFSSIGALYGHESMESSVLDRKVKYAQALRVYREVLKVDPKNPVAKQESDMIVSIYKSMGRPIPE